MNFVKRQVAWLSVLICLLSLLACGSKPESAEGNSAKASSGKRQFLSVGTAPPGGAFFVVGGALAQVAEDFKGDKNWKVSSEATKGTQENIRRLASGELDFALANAAISYFAVRGEGAWGKSHDVKAVMTLAPNVAMFIAPKANGINGLADLKGKRVVVGPAGAGFEYFLKPILEAHGVTYDDFTPLNNTQAGAVDMLADGSADAAFLGGAVPTASITQASASQDIMLIPFTEETRQKLIADYPFFFPATVKAETYRGQDAEFVGLNVGSMHLVTRGDLDDDTVYHFTKTLYEQRAEVVKKHPAGKAINPKNVIRDTGTPFHPGAIRFYKEAGIWPEDK